MKRASWGEGVCGALVLLLTFAGGVSGQEEPDSTALRVRQRLEALSRPPGTFPDSALFDSIQNAQGRTLRGGGDDLAAGDSLLAELMDVLSAYDRTSYAAKSAEFRVEQQELFLYADSIARASILRADGVELTADSLIRYDQATEIVEGEGDPTYQPAEGDPVNSQKLVFDTREMVGSALGAKTKYSQGGTTWNVDTDMPLVSQDLAYGDHARFTSCNLETPHYHFQANELKINAGNTLVAKSVKLYFADVPVAWIPFVYQSLTRGRGSGILAPRFSINDIVRTGTGYRRRVSNIGFYWAINDYMDATTALDWFDGNYTAITGNLRYRWLRQFLDGSVSFRQFFRAEGGREMSISANSRWDLSERTKFDVSGQYATSTSFVRRNSFDPREVTGQIRSQGGMSHRFDWGSLNVSADRSQSLADDRVTMSLPRMGLSISPVTLFAAPGNQAKWFNNIAWNGSMNLSRQLVDRADQLPEDGFRLGLADNGTTTASANSSLTIGRFGLSQSARMTTGSVFDVPTDSLDFFPGKVADEGIAAFYSSLGQMALADGEVTDIATTDLTWSTGINYQQSLIGTSTLTPRLSLSGQSKQIDTVDVAQSFVAAPTVVSFGAALKADIYGFYGGVGGYEAIRHKVTPSFTYDWAPGAEPTDVQRRVFGGRALQPRSVISMTLNQTWEGKRLTDTPEGGGATDPQLGGVVPVQPGQGVQAQDPLAIQPGQTPGLVPGDSIPLVDSLGNPIGEVLGPARRRLPSAEERGYTKAPQSDVTNLLSIRTSAVRYDFVEADSVGQFLSGFESTTLTNQISSDFLRGLTITMAHDLFDDTSDGETGATNRAFKPHLSRLNFGFALSARSSVFRLFGLLGSADPDAAQPPQPGDPGLSDPFAATSVTDETTVLPGRATDQAVREQRRPGGASGWSANLSYALTRPRATTSTASQVVNANLRLAPTGLWDMTWATSYDVENGQFNDHRIRLTRDLHRWQAHFDFVKTATGNWTFRFEVSLLDNADLHFDYEQRSQTLAPPSRR